MSSIATTNETSNVTSLPTAPKPQTSKEVNLSGNRLIEIKALSTLKELVKCQLQENQIISLDSLSGLPMLYVLYASGDYQPGR